MKEGKCFFCYSDATVYELLSYDAIEFRCPYCGQYIIDEDCEYDVTSGNDKFKIACVLNEKRLKGAGKIIFDNAKKLPGKISDPPKISIGEVLDEFPNKASDFLSRALLNLSRLPKKPFDLIELYFDDSKDNLHLFTSNYEESLAFIGELSEQELIRHPKPPFHGGDNKFFLTAKCWDTIETLAHTGIDNKRVFVAMWFDKSMAPYYDDGIGPAIEEAGYTPLKINMKEYNGDVCDEIIAEINRSKFVVSDFTKGRGGVYFEAGYAKGKGKEVIFTVHEDYIKDLHFDTRQYNHIVYKDPEDLRKQLLNRIRATIV
ncbi:MAG: hypothetical protein KAJ07_09545 [Planctomycetes bacterium]|nr:hypothetical protein [Planctomycetota bacterium]